MLDNLNFIAAVALRDALTEAIKAQERHLAREPLTNLRPADAAYFEEQAAARRDAIAQLTKVSKLVHKRVFEA